MPSLHETDLGPLGMLVLDPRCSFSIVWDVPFLFQWDAAIPTESESRSVMSDSLLPHGLVHGILQVIILEWVAFPFSRGSSQPKDQTQVSCIAGRFFTS